MGEIGMVYLVGAGPGDRGLLTVGARDVIARADVIIYDNLVNEAVLEYAPSHCELVYVGKSGASHTMEQEDINRLIAQKARYFTTVVRLKGGDPFIFGRGGEEALHLVESGVPFEVINGISSAYAVPSYAGIPVTHRGISASVAFITGHEDPTKESTDIHWEHIARGIQTLVFLMGVKNLPLIVEKLTENGRDSGTPVAVIQNGCYPEQTTVTGTLATIVEHVRTRGLKPPSIIVVGDVVSLRERMNWFETRPLFGKRIVVTRSREQASVLSARLAALGARVIEAPSIRITPADDGPVREALSALGSWDWIIFTSVNGVDAFFTCLNDMGGDARRLAGAKVCAIGPATAERLAARGIVADLVPPRFISDEVYRSLDDAGEITGQKFLLARADIAPEDLAVRLRGNGATRVDDVAFYRTEEEKNYDESMGRELANGYDLVTFTSSSTVRNYMRLLDRLGLPSPAAPGAVIGPVTGETARDAGIVVAAEADIHTIDGLVSAVIGYFAGIKTSGEI